MATGGGFSKLSLVCHRLWLTGLLVSVCGFLLTPRPVHPFELQDDAEKLIGWLGDVYRPEKHLPKPLVVSSISWQPRAFVVRNFLSDVEVRHIAELAAPTMHRSAVVGQNGSGVLDQYRTSYGTFIPRQKTPVLKAVEERVAWLTRIPVSHQESMQVLRYGIGQYYHQHMDSTKKKNETARLATILLYLSTPEEGGETAFPTAIGHWNDPAMPEEFGPFSDCVKGNVAFKPQRGDALLFWSLDPDGKTADPYSKHEGCPVVKGAKWTATVWVHPQPYRMYEWDEELQNYVTKRVEVDPGICADSVAKCGEWAEKGECEKNPLYMVGSEREAGHCRLACGVCEPCGEPPDRECYNRNREKAGYLLYDLQELGIPPNGLNVYDDGTL